MLLQATTLLYAMLAGIGGVEHTTVHPEFNTSLMSSSHTKMNQTTTTEPTTPCPQVCRCWSVPRVMTDCGNLELHALPAGLALTTQSLDLSRNRLNIYSLDWVENMDNLTVLDLSTNHIYTMEKWDLNSPSLHELYLDRNALEYIYEGVFEGLVNLEHLSLSHNQLELMHNDAFRSLHRLKSLNLSDNRLFEINPHWFKHTTELRNLVLSGNSIHNLRNGDFSHLSGLLKLYLDQNHLSHIQKNGFHGLDHLTHLYLNDNSFTVIPSQPLAYMRRLHLLDLSNNHENVIRSDCFKHVSTSTLILNKLNNLKLIENDAVSNIHSLTYLSISQNPNLIWIDNDAFRNLSLLQSFDLRNNSLSTFSGDVIASLPSLRDVYLQGNSLVCDCSLQWVQKEIVHQTLKLSNNSLRDLLCSRPSDGALCRISDVHLSSQCAPRLIPLFSPVVDAGLGDTEVVYCRASGQPTPKLRWTLPNAHNADSNGNVAVLGVTQAQTEKRLKSTALGTLSIEYITPADQGRYTCTATNSNGHDERSFSLKIFNLSANVLVLRVTESTITVTWRSTQSSPSHMYELLWREADSNVTYTSVAIKPYMRTYTANQLRAASSYEFCVALSHDSIRVRINCTNIITHGAGYARLGIVNTRDYIIGGVIGCAVALILITCGITVASRRFNQRRRLEELYGDNMSQMFLASMDSMSEATTPITYENRGAEMFEDEEMDDDFDLSSVSNVAFVDATSDI